MIKSQIISRLGEIQWDIHSHRKGRKVLPGDEITARVTEYFTLASVLRSDGYDPEINERSNYIDRYSHHIDRYHYDNRLKGWKQYDTSQDAWYFGIWVNVEERKILTYCEGDVIIVTCTTEENYHAELMSMAEFYGPPPQAFVGIDFDKKTVTEHYDTRPV